MFTCASGLVGQTRVTRSFNRDINMFSRELILAGHSRRFIVTPSTSSGWELKVVSDRDVVRQAFYSDWHRLERAMSAIKRSEERRVGKECRSRWSRYHEKKKEER